MRISDWSSDVCSSDLRPQAAAAEIIEEDERLRALHDKVVDAHRHQVDADRVVLAGENRDLELGADPIGRGNQQWVAVAGGLQEIGRASLRERVCQYV